MLKQLVRLALIMLLVAVACSAPATATTPTPPPTPFEVAQLIVDAAPGSTVTPTPFQPVGPTQTPIPTPTPVPTNTPKPTSSEPTAIQISQQQAPGTVNILIMGSDWRASSGFRTDVMMLVSIHTQEATISVISFPRDLYVTIPGWMEQRLNTAFPHGGFSMMANTFQSNFGVRPDYYILTNFQGFVGIIDSVGGIKVNVAKYLKDKCDLPQADHTYCTLNPGTYKMDGKTALWYVRSRHSTSDLDRLRRAQEVLFGLFSKLMTRDAVTHLPDLYQQYKSSVQTNMSIEDMAPLLPVATRVYGDPGRIRRFTVGSGMVYPYVTAGGAQVLLPNFGAIRQMIKEAVYTP